jgi:hypothetical protein
MVAVVALRQLARAAAGGSGAALDRARFSQVRCAADTRRYLSHRDKFYQSRLTKNQTL